VRRHRDGSHTHRRDESEEEPLHSLDVTTRAKSSSGGSSEARPRGRGSLAGNIKERMRRQPATFASVRPECSGGVSASEVMPFLENHGRYGVPTSNLSSSQEPPSAPMQSLMTAMRSPWIQSSS
jgi:hypothetical protein